MARPEGAVVFLAGIMRMDPVITGDEATEVCSLKDARGGIEYMRLLLNGLTAVVICPAGSRNSILPLKGISVGLTNTMCVVHPPPAAKCGNTIVAVEAAAGSSVTGKVVSRNSLRSLIRPRNATTETGRF